FSFRAWHKKNKEMVYFDNKKAAKDQYQSSAVIRLMAGDDSGVLMQHTGLTDNNGKEIYEGDILIDHVGKGVVEFADKYAGFRVNYKNGQGKWFYDYNLKGERESIQVIGNIYENPEMLEKAS
ncbi:MAG: hypothetical protein GXP14_08500, partial [Gammaproteobacteria bacterium]|nr:hypothetical protein [Gammaproteobacteria bacterium]